MNSAHLSAICGGVLSAGTANTACAPRKPKFGCLSWCFHGLSPGADPEPVPDIIGKQDFDGFASNEQAPNPGALDAGETCRDYLRIMREHI